MLHGLCMNEIANFRGDVVDDGRPEPADAFVAPGRRARARRRASARAYTREALRRCPKSRSAISPSSKPAKATFRSRCCIASRRRSTIASNGSSATRTPGTPRPRKSPRSSPPRPSSTRQQILEILNAGAARLRRQRICLIGLRGAGKIDARAPARRKPRHSLRRAQSRDRRAKRHAGQRSDGALWPGGLSAAGAAGAGAHRRDQRLPGAGGRPAASSPSPRLSISCCATFTRFG